MKHYLSIPLLMSSRAKRSGVEGSLSPAGRKKGIPPCVRFAHLVGMTISLFILFAKPAFATNTGRFTISVWVNPTTSIASKAIITKAEELRLVTDASGNPLCQFKTTTWQTAATSSLTLPTSTWSHILCTYDLTNIKIYVNGVLKGTTALTAVPDDTSAVFYAGRDASASTTYGFFTGLIDEFKFYNYNLTLDEILTDYNNGFSLIMGSLSSGTGNTAPNTAASQEYCIPGDTAVCSPPVGRWDFNEGVGTSVFDTSGSGNVGSWNGTGTHWTAGKIGKAGKFNGTDDYVNLPHSSLNVFPSSFTHEFWIKPNSFSATQGIITTHNGSGNWWHGPRLLTNGTIQLTLQNSTDSKWFGWDSTSSLNLSSWNHVAISWTNTNDINTDVKMYLNGIGIGVSVTHNSGTYSSFTPYYNSSDTVGSAIGRGNYDTPGNYFNGLIDQVRIYNYARTPSQIAWDYNEGKPVAWYKFDECQGTTLNSQNETPNTTLNATLTVGPLGTQSSVGTCALGIGTTASWGVGSTGRLNASINFDGTDDYAVTGNTALLVGAGQSAPSLSWGAWVKPSTSVASKTIINKNNEFKLETDSNSKASCNIYVGGTWKTAAVSSSALPLGSWTHVLCTYDGSNIKIWTNGTNVTNASNTGSVLSLSSTPLTIGRDPTPSQYFNGQIDEVKVWNYPLTPDLVKKDYNQGMGIRFN